jgi:hypothetical protein
MKFLEEFFLKFFSENSQDNSSEECFAKTNFQKKAKKSYL